MNYVTKAKTVSNANALDGPWKQTNNTLNNIAQKATSIALDCKNYKIGRKSKTNNTALSWRANNIKEKALKWQSKPIQHSVAQNRNGNLSHKKCITYNIIPEI